MNIRTHIRRMGPGLITAALVFGPGSLTVTTKLGAGFGYQLLWIIPVAIMLMISYTLMAARIGLRNKESFMQLVRKHYGRSASIFLGIGVFGITTSFQAGNSIGAGLAFAALFETATTPWIVFFSVVAIALLFFRSFYRILEKIMIAMVLIMLASFLVTLILSQPDLAAIASGFLPVIPAGSQMLSLALVASSFSVVAALYQSYLVQEKGWKISQSKTAMSEGRNGIIVLGLLSAMIIMCAASVLHGKGIPVQTASDLGLALQPLFGRLTTVVFMTGFFAASFSSLLGNATIGGGILADAFGLGRQLSSWRVRSMIIAIIIFGAIIAIVFGALPLELIVFAQALTILIAPAAALFLLLIANDRSIMGESANSGRMNIIPGFGLALLVVLAIYNLANLFLS